MGRQPAPAHTVVAVCGYNPYSRLIPMVLEIPQLHLIKYRNGIGPCNEIHVCFYIFHETVSQDFRTLLACMDSSKPDKTLLNFLNFFTRFFLSILYAKYPWMITVQRILKIQARKFTRSKFKVSIYWIDTDIPVYYEKKTFRIRHRNRVP